MVASSKRIASRTGVVFAAKALLIAVAAVLFLAPVASADPLGGSVCRDDVVLDGSWEEYDIYLQGGETTLIYLRGDGDTDLDLHVYCEHGNLIASDTDESDVGVAFVRPAQTGRFTIRVVNYGSVYNRFELCAF